MKYYAPDAVFAVVTPTEDPILLSPIFSRFYDNDLGVSLEDPLVLKYF